MKEKMAIRWIHLSDLHIGEPDSRWLDPTLRTRLDDLLQRTGDLDFVLITGDVIHQGQYQKKELCDQAADLLRLLKKRCDNIVFCVGNHDYTRDAVRFDILKKWGSESLNGKKKNQNTYEPKLRSDFEAYVEFCKTVLGEDQTVSTGSYIYDRVPGINIVVLNTSVFSGQPVLDENGNFVKADGNVAVNDEGKIWICEDALPDVSGLNRAYPTIVTGHHTLQMFETYSREKVIEFIRNLPSAFYFCGHIHKPEEQEIEGIKQMAAAGLFKDDYNVPSVVLHQMKKSANEHIDSQRFEFCDGDWKESAPDSVPVEEMAATLTEFEEPAAYVVENSSVSDGAIRFPYNDGTFNLYISKAAATDIITPHRHRDVDEVTYITRGSVYAYIDGEYSEMSERASLLMPKGKLHAFIPKEYPCEYITMGVEDGSQARYETEWSKDIDEISSLNAALEDCEPEKTNEIYDKIVGHLKSAVLEVRWRAIDVLKRYLAQENDDSTYIASLVQKLVLEMLKDRDVERKLFGINMACEFRTKIVAKTIHTLMTDPGESMYAWNCAYYLMKVRPAIDYDNLYGKLAEKNALDMTEHQRRCNYYQRIIVSLLQLMIKRNGNRFEAVCSEKQEDARKMIPIEDIIIHFVLWYTSLKADRINYSKARTLIPEVPGADAEEILRGLLSFDDSQERFKVLQKCRKEGMLFMVVKAFFESMEEDAEKDKEVLSAKDNIKNYLRIIVSETCNLDCVYCHHEGKIDSLIGSSLKKNDSFDLRKLLERAKECGFQKIKLSGGEPLLYPDILKTCQEYQTEFEDIGFTTNGTRIMALKAEFDKIKESNLSFNVTLNSCDPQKYKVITKGEHLKEVQDGIKYLIDSGFRVKINSVITSYNIDDIEALVAYAARMKVDIKLLDLFSVGQLPEEFQRVSIAEIKSRLMELYSVQDSDFYIVNDYMCMDAMGIRIMIPKRLYSSDCIYNCRMYPCAEGLFGIRVYEDYSCAYCFNGKVYAGTLDDFSKNVEQIRRKLDSVKFSF